MMKVIKNKLENSLYTDINKSLKSIYLFSIVSLGVFFSLYLYFVGAITFSIVKENGLKEETKSLISSMSQEELKYFTLQKKLTESYAKEIGLIPVSQVSFTSSQKAFALNVGE